MTIIIYLHVCYPNYHTIEKKAFIMCSTKPWYLLPLYFSMHYHLLTHSVWVSLVSGSSSCADGSMKSTMTSKQCYFEPKTCYQS